jgi:hypothetical protein
MGATLSETAMTTTLEPPTLFALGDWVKLKIPPYLVARIVELRGTLGPKGCHVYRLQIGKPREKQYVELREDQIEKAVKPGKPLSM